MSTSIPNLMKAINLTRNGGPEVLEYVTNHPTPSNLGPTQVLVKNEFMGINYIDTYHRTGLYPIPLPTVLGREGAGTVVKVGSQVQGLKEGDRVAYIGSGGYAEYGSIPKVKIDTKTAAASLLQGLTALAFTTKSYAIQRGDIALIHAAAGGTGSLLVQMVKAFGGIVIGTTSSPHKLQHLKDEIGVDHAICYNSEAVSDSGSAEFKQFRESVFEIVRSVRGSEGGVNVVYDGVGKATFDISLECLAPLGSMISFGNASGKVPPFDISRLSKGSVRLMRPTLMSYISTEESFTSMSSQLWELIEAEKVKIRIHKVYPLDQVQSAHIDLESKGTTGKLLLAPN